MVSFGFILVLSEFMSTTHSKNRILQSIIMMLSNGVNMRIEKVISWLIRQIPDRFFDVLSGTECAEIDGIAHDGLLHDTEHKTAYPVAGRGFRKVDN